ncbi:class I SAM-dependent methyltransferase [Micromonospora sp. NBC_00362]|uniref:class I SAM-dependent methyltransferase n=1 Tax=Micromonospora sp. NBC_00362 TaxID=2975975 RepID=UPI00225C36DC|nr:class I SAM-dependent methyltransferase [Micromonospora sp. NBC_00362]MCX5117664.1 class I SAM-dependent methyltransferase [Micromonospora sp. NBC_00362]
MTTETAPVDRITLPGGEMLAWSDLPQERLADGGPLAALAARLVPPGARVLVAGPHDPALLDQLTHAEVTCLLRSHPDAVALAHRAARVVVGGPAGLPDDETYDVVIAAAGLDPVESVEGTRLGWDGVLARLVAAVRPGGALLLRLDNPLGLHRLVGTSPWYARRDDSAWVIGGVLDRAHPANRDQLRERLGAAGLRPAACWAAYPGVTTPTALLDADHLDRDAGSGLFDAVLHGACAGGFSSATVLQDPARLAVDALHAGRAADLAPGWLTLAHRPADPADPTTPTVEADLPVALVQTGRPGIGVLEVLHGPSGWRWGLIPATDATTPAVAPFASREAAYRDADALSGPVPSGRLLRTLLLDAAVRRDLATLRALLRGYAGWLADQADTDGRIAGAAALAGTDNVVVDGERYAVLDPSWRATAALPGDVVLARGLWRFATGLLTGGYAHPWSSTLDIAGLTVVLGGLAGHDLDRATVSDAVEVEAAIAAALHGLDAGATVGLATELQAVTPTDPPVGGHSYQQLREAWLRQREELTRLAALTAWTEELLTSRERALRRAETTIGLLSGSLSYRVGRLAITPARLAKRGARAAKRRATAALAPKQEEQQ